MSAQPVSIPLGEDRAVSGLWQAPDDARCCLVLAHGAGADMNHRAMTAIAEGLGRLGVATLRYQFPYTELGRMRAGDLPLFAGGKSFGGRMTSQAQAQSPLDGVRGLVFFGFPLHGPGKPGVERSAHLSAVTVPMLFVQGSRDALAELALLQGVVAALGERASLQLIADADHSFHVPARTGGKDAEVLDEALTQAVAWMRAVGEGG
jgi:predicted alpha/beta-hydrolase family hydrolase